MARLCGGPWPSTAWRGSSPSGCGSRTGPASGGTEEPGLAALQGRAGSGDPGTEATSVAARAPLLQLPPAPGARATYSACGGSRVSKARVVACLRRFYVAGPRAAAAAVSVSGVRIDSDLRDESNSTDM